MVTGPPPGGEDRMVEIGDGRPHGADLPEARARSAATVEAVAHRRTLWLAVVASVLEVKLLDELGDLDAARAGVGRVLAALAVAEAALPAPGGKPAEGVEG